MVQTGQAMLDMARVVPPPTGSQRGGTWALRPFPPVFLVNSVASSRYIDFFCCPFEALEALAFAGHGVGAAPGVFFGFFLLADGGLCGPGSLGELVFHAFYPSTKADGIAAGAFDEDEPTALLKDDVRLVEGAGAGGAAHVLGAVAVAEGQVAVTL